MEEESENSINTIDRTTVFKFSVNHFKNLALQNDDTEFNSDEYSIKIEHSEYTDIELVGLQIWNGALLLADYIIHHGNELLSDKKVLELASGTGFVSIIASLYNAHVICTDINEPKIMEIMRKNVENNKHLIKGTIFIQAFDFFEKWSPFIEEKIEETEIILISEAIYDNDITDGLIEQMIKIFRKNAKIIFIMSLEKRYIFSALNLRVEATHHEYFFERLQDKEKLINLKLKADRIEVNFPQYFRNYERSKELELWRFAMQ